MNIAYKNFNFRPATLALITRANEIIKEYAADGFDLTLRQLYYQFVARGIIPNKQNEYKKLGSAVNDARLAGKIDWNSIVDRTRKYGANNHWNNPAEILNSAANCYRIDTRQDQEIYLEVWVEKDALISVVERACSPLDLGYLSCRGYVSQSAMHNAAHRMKNQEQEKTVLLYLGDHDPSGLDMTRDIQDRLDLFGAGTEVKRIALSMDQIKELQPPPNPAKVTDSRYQNYKDQFGEESWELDALDPRYLMELIQKHIRENTEEKKRQALINKQETARTKLYEIAGTLTDY